MQSCGRCLLTVDPAVLPVVKREIPATGGLPGFIQEDRNCPSCGNLILRSIDGEPVNANYKDSRPDRAAKLSRESFAKVAAENAAAAKKATDKKISKRVKPSK